MLGELLSEGCQDIGFCHNDLQYGNIMIDEETRQITLIVSYLAVLCLYMFSLYIYIYFTF